MPVVCCSPQSGRLQSSPTGLGRMPAGQRNGGRAFHLISKPTSGQPHHHDILSFRMGESVRGPKNDHRIARPPQPTAANLGPATTAIGSRNATNHAHPPSTTLGNLILWLHSPPSPMSASRRPRSTAGSARTHNVPQRTKDRKKGRDPLRPRHVLQATFALPCLARVVGPAEFVHPIDRGRAKREPMTGASLLRSVYDDWN